MKKNLIEKIELPEGVSCELVLGVLKCRKGTSESSRKIAAPGLIVRVEENSVVFEFPKGNKRQLKVLYSYLSHLKNMFRGLENNFVYKLEACNVHFPMTLKVDKDYVLINNFLGEKNPRKAKILPGVKVEIKGNNITVSSNDRESAGQTAANMEKATIVRNRDRRIFQDGIYIVEKPGREI